MADQFTTQHALESQDVFWQKDFLARPHLCRVSECSFMAGTYAPNAGAQYS